MAQTLLVSRFQKSGTEMAMDLERCPENRARPRVPRLVSGFVGLYVNRMETLAHRPSHHRITEARRKTGRLKDPRPITVQGHVTVGSGRPIYWFLYDSVSRW